MRESERDSGVRHGCCQRMHSSPIRTHTHTTHTHSLSLPPPLLLTVLFCFVLFLLDATTDDAEQVQVSFEELDFALLQSPADRRDFMEALNLALEAQGVDTGALCDTSLLAGSVIVNIIVPDELLDSLLAAIASGEITVSSGGQTAVARIVPSTPSAATDLCIAKTTTGGERCLCNPLRNCHECILDVLDDGAGFRGSICTLCKNGRYLHNGECVEQCPNGTKPDGEGLFNLRCAPVLEEPTWRLVSPEARVVFSNSPSVLRPQIVIGRATNSLSVRFRASTNGQVFFTSGSGGAAYISVALRNGAVLTTVNLGFGATVLNTATSGVDVGFVDNQWHSLRVTRAGTALSLAVDNHPVIHGSISAPLSHSAQFGPLVYVGKAAQAPGTFGFVGCVDEMLLEDVPLTLAQAQSIFDVSDCDADGCSAGPCENGATCVPTTEAFYCLCAAGFTGFTCDTPHDLCASLRPCKNGGECSTVGGSDGEDEGFVCDCPINFTGDLCETGLFCFHVSVCL